MPQPQTAFEASLLPASYKGVGFGVLDSSIAVGQRVEVHEYPFRNLPFTEQLGRRARRLQFTAFLIGADVAARSMALQDALEQKGAGSLVHPSYGAMSMSVSEPA